MNACIDRFGYIIEMNGRGASTTIVKHQSIPWCAIFGAGLLSSSTPVVTFAMHFKRRQFFYFIISVFDQLACIVGIKYDTVTKNHNKMPSITPLLHYSGVIISAMVSEIASVSIVCSTVCAGADKKDFKACVTGLCERNLSVTGGFSHKGPVTCKKVTLEEMLFWYLRILLSVGLIRIHLWFV